MALGNSTKTVFRSNTSGVYGTAPTEPKTLRAYKERSLHKGYLRISIVNKIYSVHHLVALAFCLKGEGKECVNHIDENSTNNKASNLEFCTIQENNIYAIRLGL
ncbi:5566_t:CDS:2, partial [Diversispora eburnea]